MPLASGPTYPKIVLIGSGLSCSGEVEEPAREGFIKPMTPAPV